MANFHGHQIPQAGQNLMAKLFATGRPLVYTSVKVGDGALNGRLVSGLTGLIGLKKSFPIAATPIRSGDGRWNVTAIFNNADIDADFWWREWGVFAEDPDTGQEVLVAYANAGDTADYIHAWTGSDDSSYVEEQITCTCVVSSDLEVTALIDPSQLYVLLEVYQEHLKEFIAHRDDKGNPHGVTAAQIGAAAAGHTHTAADVGALPANTAYVPPTRRVAGKALSADVTLSKADVGLGSVDNTADSAKSVKYATSAGSTSGNAGTATKLQTARAIDGVSFDGSAAITHYGSCSTAAATAAKVVACAGFTLVTGAVIRVKFTITNTAANPTLNVNGTGAKPIYYRGAAIAAGYLAANRTYEFVYNGTQFELVGDLDTNTTYTAAAAAPKALGTAAVGTSAKYAREDHVHPLQTPAQMPAGTLPAGVLATNSTDYTTSRLRNIRAGTADLTAGTSALNNGEIYLVYE